MSWLGSLAGGLATGLLGFGSGLASNYFNGMMSTAFSKELQENQGAVNYKYAQKSAENSPTWTRQGLESAGYNPMLAVQNATSGANAGWTAGNTMSPQDLTSSMSNIVSNAQSFQRLKNETNTADSVADANYANADKAKADKALSLAKLPYVSAREKAEIANTEKQSAKLENDIHYQNELINYYNNSLKLQEMGLEPQIINAGANATNAKTNRLQYQIDKEVQDIVRDKEKRYKEWGRKHPYLRNVDETLSRYFNGFGANASRSVSTKR